MKHKRTDLYLIIYWLIVATGTLFWANNFQRFVHMKGEDFEMCVETIVPFTYLLFICIQLSIRRLNSVLLACLPIGIAIVSFFTGFLILLVTGLQGFPRQVIYVYSFTYAAITSVYIKARWIRALTA